MCRRESASSAVPLAHGGVEHFALLLLPIRLRPVARRRRHSQQPPSSGSTVRVLGRELVVDRSADQLAHRGADSLRFPRQKLEALVVDENLKSPIQHAHTLAGYMRIPAQIARRACFGSSSPAASASARFAQRLSSRRARTILWTSSGPSARRSMRLKRQRAALTTTLSHRLPSPRGSNLVLGQGFYSRQRGQTTERVCCVVGRRDYVRERSFGRGR